MSRNRIEANETIFKRLDAHCALRGFRLSNSGQPRWIQSEKRHHHFMNNAKLDEKIVFSPGRMLSIFSITTKIFLCSVGFEHEVELSEGLELELDSGFLTVVLAELAPRPTSTVDEIRQIVEVDDKSASPDYKGHLHNSVATLFPSIKIIELKPGIKNQIWNMFFRICVKECELGLSWMNLELTGTLLSLCDLNPSRIPYSVLCRSIFDSDPGSFFLAQYRCLEALYSFDSAKTLIEALGISTSWANMATALEQQLGWHPREQNSLTKLLESANDSDLRLAISALKIFKPVSKEERLSTQVATIIYQLRNSLVHYRPAQHQIKLSDVAWTDICEAMTGIVLDVYQNVFENETSV